MPPGARYRAAGERGPGDPGGLVCPPFDVRGRLAALERARRRGARRDRRRGDGAPRAAGRAGGGGEMRQLAAPRLFPKIPPRRYLCFYPMSKRRGEQVNWYDLPPAARAELMRGHGEIGRKYAGQVTQVIAGSIGLDDWEWGVTLFAD